MLAVAHDAQMNTKNADGVSRRDELEASAKLGNPHAIKALEGPASPDAVEYLLDWAQELVGRSGASMDGFAPLSWNTIDAWARRTGRNPTDAECRALLQLDAAIRHPDLVAQRAD